MELILAFDPLCMWSYAFAHVVEEFVHRHKDEFFTSVVCSGMIRGDLRVGAGHQKERLLEASRLISDQSGIPFGPAFFENIDRNTMVLDSVPGSTAVNLIKQIQKPFVLDFAIDLSRHIFAHGMDPSDHRQIAGLMTSYGVDFEEGLYYLQTDKGRYLAYQDFQWFEGASLKRTPVLILNVENELIQLTQGYTDLAGLERVYQKVSEKYSFRLN